jgi:hypothetical protein
MCSQVKALKKHGRSLTKGLALGTRRVPNKLKAKPKSRTTRQHLESAK